MVVMVSTIRQRFWGWMNGTKQDNDGRPSYRMKTTIRKSSCRIFAEKSTTSIRLQGKKSQLREVNHFNKFIQDLNPLFYAMCISYRGNIDVFFWCSYFLETNCGTLLSFPCVLCNICLFSSSISSHLSNRSSSKLSSPVLCIEKAFSAPLKAAVTIGMLFRAHLSLEVVGSPIVCYIHSKSISVPLQTIPQ